MALASTNLTAEPRSMSIGPVKIQIKTMSVANLDTSGTVTFDALSAVEAVIQDAVRQTAAATFSGNAATLTFVDPGAAGAVGVIIGVGR